LHSSPAPLAEPTILPLGPLVAGNALVAPLYTLWVDLVLGREEARVVVAVQGVLPIGDKGAALEKERKTSVQCSLVGSSYGGSITSLMYAPESGASSRSLYAVSPMSEVTASATSEGTSVG
jgi:hypothetical protein